MAALPLPLLSPPARATFVEGSDQDSINIVLDGEPVVLTSGDCISFFRVVDGVGSYTTARILHFGFSGGLYVNRIFFLPFVDGVWAEPVLPLRHIRLVEPYFGNNGGGDWTTIVKLKKCPEQSGGTRRNRRATKKARINRRRYTRRS
jgi:hypothetical protein